MLVALVSCSGGDDTAENETSSNSTTSAPGVSATSVPADDSGSAATTVVPVDDEPAPTTAPPITVPLIEGLAAEVELLTASSGTGIRPLLEWSPLGGASMYMATVYSPDGSPYWTWTGAATSVHVGGDPVLDDSVPGPSVIEGMTWGVVAFDDEVVPIALSSRQAISP